MTPNDAKKDVLPALKEALIRELNFPPGAEVDLRESDNPMCPGKYDVILTIRGMPPLSVFKRIEELHYQCGMGHPDNKFGSIITMFL